jgi:hypothetical protein
VCTFCLRTRRGVPGALLAIPRGIPHLVLGASTTTVVVVVRCVRTQAVDLTTPSPPSHGMGDSTNIKRTRSGRLSHDPEPISGDPKDAGLVLLGPQASPEPGNPEGPRRFPFPVNHAALVTNHAGASSREPPTAAWPHWAYGRSYLDAICIDRQRPALAAWERGDVHGTRGSIDSAPIGRAQRLSISIGTGRVIGGRGIAADAT